MHEFLHMLVHSVVHSFEHSIITLPLLFAVYLLIEYLDHKAAGKLPQTLQKMGKFGPIGGAVLGCFPQCGFSVAASNLYAGRLITVGTLIAVYLSTSDEAIPVLIANPDKIGMVVWLILIKVIIAVVAGFIVDFAVSCAKKNEYNFDTMPCAEICEHEHEHGGCGCKHGGIFKTALIRTLKIFLFILVVNIVLHVIMHLVGGQEAIASALMQIKWLQPIIAGVLGLIPNCAISIVLTQLYVDGSLTFGSLIAGLSTGAGLGIAVLFRTNKHVKQNIVITALTLGFGIAAGFIVDLIAMAF